jgi:hypothetical protein
MSAIEHCESWCAYAVDDDEGTTTPALPATEEAELDAITGCIKYPGAISTSGACGGMHLLSLIIESRPDQLGWPAM